MSHKKKSFNQAFSDFVWFMIDEKSKAAALKRQADIRILAAKQAEDKAELARLRALQVQAQTDGIVARRIRSQIGQDIDRNRKNQQYAQIESLELKNQKLELEIQKLRKELGYTDAADSFTPTNYQP